MADRFMLWDGGEMVRFAGAGRWNRTFWTLPRCIWVELQLCCNLCWSQIWLWRWERIIKRWVYKTTWSKNDINFVSISPTPPVDTEGVARDLQELSDYRRMERFRNVLQEHVMNDAHRYAFHRGLAAPNTLPWHEHWAYCTIRGLRVHLLHERCPFGPGVWCSEVCQWLSEDRPSGVLLRWDDKPRSHTITYIRMIWLHTPH